MQPNASILLYRRCARSCISHARGDAKREAACISLSNAQQGARRGEFRERTKKSRKSGEINLLSSKKREQEDEPRASPFDARQHHHLTPSEGRRTALAHETYGQDDNKEKQRSQTGGKGAARRGMVQKAAHDNEEAVLKETRRTTRVTPRLSRQREHAA
ncbi:hypothetical protein BESB_049810 [Besnoitia besnoiti]|uniref:Uncharacterized protein n=1 Tax=Besnoitia besnoiti TaxID=94643 RepID=A0A2A9MFS7_BESBE|nr:hypothetical protein BESB_049810 [Besnoitia besnoiti]PFH36789.1 hypothetical protein BESB_049810 [Besnoitia besnoiti]